MSGKAESDAVLKASARDARPSNRDPRIPFTREVLGDALVQLIEEHPFEQITVQDILDRAGVGRTTFYAHYSGKQDLFLSDVEEFLENMATFLERHHAPLTRLVPVHELFAHLGNVTTFYKALIASGKITEIRELGIGCFAKSIERRLSQAGSVIPGPELHNTSLALAGALFAMLDGWMCASDRMSPDQMDQIFHRLAWNGVILPSVGHPPSH